MSVAGAFAPLVVALTVVALAVTLLRRPTGKARQRQLEKMSTLDLLQYCRYDGPDGAELNDYAKEYERRRERDTKSASRS